MPYNGQISRSGYAYFYLRGFDGCGLDAGGLGVLDTCENGGCYIMGDVIQMFREDELTGMRIPNVRLETQYMVVLPAIGAVAVYRTKNEAIAHCYRHGLDDAWIEEV